MTLLQHSHFLNAISHVWEINSLLDICKKKKKDNWHRQINEGIYEQILYITVGRVIQTSHFHLSLS